MYERGRGTGAEAERRYGEAEGGLDLGRVPSYATGLNRRIGRLGETHRPKKPRGAQWRHLANTTDRSVWRPRYTTAVSNSGRVLLFAVFLFRQRRGSVVRKPCTRHAEYERLRTDGGFLV